MGKMIRGMVAMPVASASSSHHSGPWGSEEKRTSTQLSGVIQWGQQQVQLMLHEWLPHPSELSSAHCPRHLFYPVIWWESCNKTPTRLHVSNWPNLYIYHCLQICCCFKVKDIPYFYRFHGNWWNGFTVTFVTYYHHEEIAVLNLLYNKGPVDGRANN